MVETETEAERILAFRNTLRDLVCNSKPHIMMLTELAAAEAGSESAAAGIARVIENRIREVRSAKVNERRPGEKPVPAEETEITLLYLIDSIVKNAKDPNQRYLHLFTQNIVSNFCEFFKKSGEKIRNRLFKLRNTWTGIFPADKLAALDHRIKQLDPAWPFAPTAASPPAPQPTPTQQQPPTTTTAPGIKKAGPRQPANLNKRTMQQMNPLPQQPQVKGRKANEQQRKRQRMARENPASRNQFPYDTALVQMNGDYPQPSPPAPVVMQQTGPIYSRRPVVVQPQPIMSTFGQPNPVVPIEEQFHRQNYPMIRADAFVPQLPPVIPTPFEPIPPQLPVPSAVSSLLASLASSEPSTSKNPLQNVVDLLRSSAGESAPAKTPAPRPQPDFSVPGGQVGQAGSQNPRDPPLEWTAESLRIRRKGLVSDLYIGQQCSSCPRRFFPRDKSYYSKNPEEEAEEKQKYAAHVQWHYRQNKAKKARAGKAGQARAWYYSFNDWLKFTEVNEESEFAAKADSPNAEDQEQEEEVKTVAARTNPDLNKCFMCAEVFEPLFQEDEEQWVLCNAVLHEDSVFHPECLTDFLKNGSLVASAANVSMEEEKEVEEEKEQEKEEETVAGSDHLIIPAPEEEQELHQGDESVDYEEDKAEQEGNLDEEAAGDGEPSLASGDGVDKPSAAVPAAEVNVVFSGKEESAACCIM